MAKSNSKIFRNNLRLLQILNEAEEIIWIGKSRNTQYTRLSEDGHSLAFLIGAGLTAGLLLVMLRIEKKYDITILDVSEVGAIFVYIMLFLFIAAFIGMFFSGIFKTLHFSRALFVVTNQRFFEFMPDAGITENCFELEDIKRVLLSENKRRFPDVIVTGKLLDGKFNRMIVAENEDARELFKILEELK